MAGALSSAAGAARGAAGAVQGIAGSAATAGGAIARSVNGALQRAVGLARQLGGTLRRVGGGLAGAAGGLGTAAGLVTAVFGFRSIQEAIAWQEQMAKIDTIARFETPAAMEAASRGLQDLSIQFGISTDDMAEAQYEFLSAGIGLFKQMVDGQIQVVTNTEQTRQALQAAGNFAVATLSSQTEATQLLSFALNAYNLNQESFSKGLAKQAGLFDRSGKSASGFAQTMGDAARVISDQFAKAVEVGVVTGPQIARSFATVAASAKVAGIGIDEIAAAYASQTVRGVSAARVTVSMNRAIQDLIKPGKALQEMMAETGNNYAKIARTQGIHEALQQMRTDANRLGIEYATLFKRQEGWRFALNITQDDLADAAGNFRLYEITLEEIQNASSGVGTATEQAEKRMHTAGREVQRVALAFKILKQTVGEPLLEPLAELLRVITRFEVKLIDLARTDAGKRFVEQMGPIIGLVSGMLALTAGTQGLLYVLQPIAPLFGTTATNMRAMGAVIGRIVGPIAVLIGLIGAFKFAVENNVRGFGQLSDELQAMKDLAAGVVEVFRTIGESISYVWDTIGLGGNVDAAISTSLDRIGQAVENLGPAFEQVTKFIASFVYSVGTLLVNALAAAIPAIANWAVSVAQAAAPKIAYLLGAFVGWASEVVPRIIENLGNFVGEVAQWAQDVAPQVAGVLGAILTGIADWARSVVPTIVSGLGDFAGEVGNWIGRTLPVVRRSLELWLISVQAWFRDVGPRIAETLGAWGEAAANFIRNDFFPAVSQALGSFLDRVITFLRDTDFVRVFTGWVLKFIGGIAFLLAQVAQVIIQNADKIIAAFLEIAGQAIGAFIDFIVEYGPQIVGALGNAITSNPGAFLQAIAVIIGLIATYGAISAALNIAGGFIADALFKASIMRGKLLDGVSGALSGIASGAGQAIGSGIRKLGTMIGEGVRKAASWAMVQAQAWVSVLSQLADPITAKLSAILGRAGLTAGGVGAAAITAGLLAAAIVVPVTLIIAFTEATNNLRDEAVRKAREIADAAFEDGTLESYEAARERLESHIQRQESVLAGPVVRGDKNAERTLDDLKKVHADFLRQYEWFNNQRAGLDPFGRANADQWGPNSPMSGAFNPRGWTRSMADEAELARREAEKQQNLLVDQFNAGVRGRLSGIDLWDWRSLFQKNSEELSAEAQALQENFETTISEASQRLRSTVRGIDNPLEDLFKTDKKGRRRLTLKSDKARIAEVQKEIEWAQRQLARAERKGDTATATELVNYIGTLQGQKDALVHGAELLNAAKVDLAKENANTATVLDGINQGPSGAAITQAAEANATFSGLISERAAQIARWTKLNEEPPEGWPGSGTGTTPKVPTVSGVTPVPQGPTPQQQAAAVEPYIMIASNVKAALNGIVGPAKEAGQNAVLSFDEGILSVAGTVQAAIASLFLGVGRYFNSLSWFSYGVKLVRTLINGMTSQLDELRETSFTVATTAGRGVRHESPAKEGPLRGVPRWGREMVRQFALGMNAGIPFVYDASMQLAGAVALPGGPREIAPINMGGRGGIHANGGAAGMDREYLDRQVELLADIAQATRLGAAASAQGVARDPRAGGPLAARSALVSFKQMGPSRVRGGIG